MRDDLEVVDLEIEYLSKVEKIIPGNILKRIKDRRVCKDCKKTHTSSDKQCPYCGGESVIREDDAKIEPRLQSYRRHTLPLWDILDLAGNTYRVDGTVESDIIADNVVKLLF